MSLCAPTEVSTASAETLRSILERLDPEGSERRHAQRSSFAYRLRLTALDEPAPTGRPLYVTGRDFSAHGVGFSHDDQLTHRRVRLSAADPVLSELGLADLEIDLLLRWCRFVSSGVYESGGRVTRATINLG